MRRNRSSLGIPRLGVAIYWPLLLGLLLGSAFINGFPSHFLSIAPPHLGVTINVDKAVKASDSNLSPSLKQQLALRQVATTKAWDAAYYWASNTICGELANTNSSLLTSTYNSLAAPGVSQQWISWQAPSLDLTSPPASGTWLDGRSILASAKSAPITEEFCAISGFSTHVNFSGVPFAPVLISATTSSASLVVPVGAEIGWSTTVGSTKTFHHLLFVTTLGVVVTSRGATTVDVIGTKATGTPPIGRVSLWWYSTTATKTPQWISSQGSLIAPANAYHDNLLTEPSVATTPAAPSSHYYSSLMPGDVSTQWVVPQPVNFYAPYLPSAQKKELVS